MVPIDPGPALHRSRWYQEEKLGWGSKREGGDDVLDGWKDEVEVAASEGAILSRPVDHSRL